MLGGNSAKPTNESCRARGDLVVQFGRECTKCGDTGGHCQRISRKRSGLIHAARRRDVLHQIATSAVNGDGQTTKVANQIIVALTIEAVAEGLLFASKAGADPARVRQALMGGLATSRILEVHGERMIKRTFDPGFRIELHQKDLNLALQGARSLGVSLPNTATCQELFSACAAAGGAAWDHSALVRALERMACHEVGETKRASAEQR